LDLDLDSRSEGHEGYSYEEEEELFYEITDALKEEIENKIKSGEIMLYAPPNPDREFDLYKPPYDDLEYLPLVLGIFERAADEPKR
jgi:hypothetical protein